MAPATITLTREEISVLHSAVAGLAEALMEDGCGEDHPEMERLRMLQERLRAAARST